MTNLLLAYNSIPMQGKTVTTSYTDSDLNNVYNLLTNKRSDYSLVNSGATWNISFDLGLDDSAAAITKAAEYVILTSALTTLNASLTFYLEHSPDNSAWTTATSFTNTDAAAAIKGLMRADYIKTFAITSARRYWRIRCSGGSPGVSKCYFGQFFDLEVDPHDIVLQSPKQDPFYADGGYTTYGIKTPSLGTYKIEWRGISKVKKEEFTAIVQGLPDRPLFFLYQQTNTDVFNGENLLAVNLEDYTFDTLATDYYVLTANFKDSL